MITFNLYCTFLSSAKHFFMFFIIIINKIRVGMETEIKSNEVVEKINEVKTINEE